MSPPSLTDQINAEFDSLDDAGNAALARIQTVNLDHADELVLAQLAADVGEIIRKRKEIARYVKTAILIAKEAPALIAKL